MMKALIARITDFFYSIPGVLFINFYKLVTRTRVINKKRLPGNKSIILAINHSSDADPLLILSALKKKIYFIAESENFRSRLTNFFMRKFANCIPIFKEQSLKNINSFKELFSISNKKNVFFGIFPEGVINKEVDIKRFHKGAAYFSYKTKIPIIPIYLRNTKNGPEGKSWFWTNRITRGISSLTINAFRKIHIFIGEPIDPIAENIVKDFKDLAYGKAYRQITENIHEALKEEFLELQIEADDFLGAETEQDNIERST